MDLVIAKLNEDVSWIKDLPYRIFLYDKSSQPINNSIHLPNYGNEADTYLYHIINNYNNLDKFVVFSQANFTDHQPNFLEILENLSIKQNMFSSFTEEIFHCDHDGNPNYPGLKINNFVKRFNIQVPRTLTFNEGAIFGVSRDLILAYPKQFYINLNSCNKEDNFAHIMERLWEYIFTVHSSSS